MPIDYLAAERAVAEFLRALGHDPASDPELFETPARVTEAFARDLLSGYAVDLDELIRTGASDSVEPPPADSRQFVVVRNIRVATVCPHHLLPALGSGTVVYQPGSRLLGLGTIARIVDALSRRLVVQELIGQRVVATLIERAGARGAYCALELVHSCLSARGARQSDAIVRTVASGGSLVGPQAAEELSLALGESRREKSEIDP
jgi:GTP cyclohydrolase I